MKMAGQWNDTALTSGLRFAAHFTRDNGSYREQNGGLTMRAPLTGAGTGDPARLSSSSKRRERTEVCFRPQRHGMRKSDGLLGKGLDIQRAS